MSTVLVTDGEQRSALAAVRSLGRAGHRVLVCSPRRLCMAGASRFCVRHRQAPDPLSDPAGFVASVIDLIRSTNVEVILPMTEASLLAVLPERERFAGVRIPFPDLKRFVAICDKAAVTAAAERVGIRVPRQLVLAAPSLAPAEAAELRFPLVIKPARSVSGEAGSRAKHGVVHARDAGSLAAILKVLPAAAFPALLQERIVGPGVGIFLLLRDGEPAAAFAHRRIREKPPSGGVSVYRESIPLDAGLLEQSVALLRHFDWDGVAMVEYKVDEGTGMPYIMEINGRFWGSLQLALDAGVDFPRLLVDGGSNPLNDGYAAGVRSRWEWGDVDHLLARLRRSPEFLALPEGAPSRGRAVVDFLRAFAPPARPEVFRWSDPRPFLQESADWLRRR
jgi:predicted ATP-grasp superfamily ATP-dependent carboligase